MKRKNTLPMIILILSLSFSYLFIGGVFMLSFNAFFQNKEYERFQSIIINYLSANIPLIILFIFSIILTHILLNTSVIAMVRDKKYEIRVYVLTILITASVLLFFTFLFNKSIAFESSTTIFEKIYIAFIVLIITPLQCFSEEYLFRVSFARLFNSNNMITKILLSIFSGIIFLLAHMFSNPEFQIASSFLLYFYYFQFGFLSMLLGLCLEDFSFAIIIHSINNLFSIIICGYIGSPLESAPFFISSQIPSPLLSNIALCVIFALTYFCAKKNLGRN